MAIIIGNATQVTFGASDTCIVSAQWSLNANLQEVYCLGSWEANTQFSFLKPENTVSLTLYAPGPTYATPASNSCSDANTLAVRISAQGCGTGGCSLYDFDGFVTSYSYSKDSKETPAQESWSLTQYLPISDLSGSAVPNLNQVVLRGTTKGQSTQGVNTGIVFSQELSSGTSGNVSAGGVGRCDTTVFGIISSVGGGEGTVGSEPGNGSAQIPYNLLYI